MAVQLQTDKADTHTELTGSIVNNLPLGGNLNYQTLINLTPGSIPAAFINSESDNPAAPLNTHINGAAGQTKVSRIDGAESVNIWLPQYSGYVTRAEDIEVVNVTRPPPTRSKAMAAPRRSAWSRKPEPTRCTGALSSFTTTST